MKTQLTMLNEASRTSEVTALVSGRKPILALVMRLLWAVALVLPSFGAQGAVILTSLHQFSVVTNGIALWAALVQGQDGNFYGTTYYGGTNGGWGTVFKISTNGALTSLYSFTGGNDGAHPSSSLVQGRDGSFYGTASEGGTNYNGTVFKISTNGVLISLYSFTGGNDGGLPYAGLIQGRDGYFYGTTEFGGTSGNGTVFKTSANGVLTSLHSFTGGNDGARPHAGVVQGSDGYLYGTTESGGTYANGTVFRISTNGVLTSLRSFTGSADGGQPYAALVQGRDGYFYGTTESGGSSGNGTVFKVSANGVLTSLHSFTGADGGQPYAGLVQGSDGYFYGTTESGGIYTNGTVFKISANGTLTTLCCFADGNNGAYPEAGLVQGRDGNFYGATPWTVFKISANGTLTTLYCFTGSNDGEEPDAGLVQGNDGNFYGTTRGGGTNGWGTVFKISTNGALKTFYSFGSVQDTNGFSLDGAHPVAGLVQGRDGSFYGTTEDGGTNYVGTVFRISTNGVLTSLYSFINGLPNAWSPVAGLVQGSDGNFYGTTQYGGTGPIIEYGDYGTAFRISPSGWLTTLHSFGTIWGDGAHPVAALLQGLDGNFYGTTSDGGTNNAGTVFKMSTTGALTSLYSFTFGDNGWGPAAGLVQGSDGYLRLVPKRNLQ